MCTRSKHVKSKCEKYYTFLVVWDVIQQLNCNKPRDEHPPMTDDPAVSEIQQSLNTSCDTITSYLICQRAADELFTKRGHLVVWCTVNSWVQASDEYTSHWPPITLISGYWRNPPGRINYLT